MRLPSQLLAKLTLTGVAVAAGCENTDERCAAEPVVTVDDTPLREILRAPHDVAAAPKLVPPPPPTRVQPQPTVQKRPKPRKVLASICGHVELVDDAAALARCGRG